MAKYLSLVSRRLPVCQRCGGQVIRYFDDLNCLQCGAPHTGKYQLAAWPMEEVPGSHPRSKRRYNERKRVRFY